MDDRTLRAKEEEAGKSSASPMAPQNDLLEMLDYFFEESSKLPLTAEHLRGGSASKSESKPGLGPLRDELGIDPGVFSRWRNGSHHKDERQGEHLKTTKAFADLFKGRKDAYLVKNKEKQGIVRKFRAELINHWNAANPGLISAIVQHLDAHAVYLREQERLRADFKLSGLLASGRPELGRLKPTTRQYVQRLTADTLPPGLHTTFKREAFGRQRYVDALVNLYMDPASRNGLVTVDGPRFSGKSSVIRAGVYQLAREYKERNDQPSLLFVDLTAAESPQRALYLALGGRVSATEPRSDAASFSDGSGAEDDVDRQAAEWGEVLRSLWPPVDSLSGRLVVFDGYTQIDANETTSRQIQALIEQTPIKTCFVVVESAAGEISPRAMTRRSLTLEALKSNEAVEFLEGPCSVPGDLARSGIAELAGYHEVFHPGPLRFGSGNFHREVIVTRSKEPDPRDLSWSILKAATEVAELVVLSILRHDEGATESAIQSLMAMAVIAMAPVSDDVLARSDLSPIPREALQRKGWFADNENLRLTGFALHAMRARAAQQLAGANESRTETPDALMSAVKRLLLAVGSDSRIEMDTVVENAVAWLAHTVSRDNPLLTHLSSLLIQSTVHDDVRPLSEEMEIAAAAEFRKRATENFDVGFAISALVIAARTTRDSLAIQRDNFLTALEMLMNTVRGDMTIDALQLTGIDGALSHGMHRYEVFDQVLIARNRILAILDRADHEQSRGQNMSPALVGFKINTADLLITSGDVAAAKALTNQVDTTIGSIRDEDRDSFTYWVMTRTAMLRSRMMPALSEQCLEMERACLHAQKSLQVEPQRRQNWRFLLRMVSRYVQLEASVKPRQQIVDSTIALLKELYGEPENWVAELRGRAASLLRRTVRFERSPEARKEIARKAMKILVPARGVDSEDLDTLGLLVKARLHALLDEPKAALRICRDLSVSHPSVDTWTLRLLLEDGETGETDEMSGTAMFDVVENAHIGDSLNSAMVDAEEWLKQLPEFEKQSPRVAQLWLWIKSRRWKEVGSLERVVRNEVDREGRQFDRMPLEYKLDRLRKVFRERESALSGVERHCKRSVDLVYARARNCAQFVRSQAVNSGQEPESDKVLDLYNRGLKEFPGSSALLFHKAEYCRYIWRTSEAISGFREVLSKAKRADLRQTAALSLARTLHVSAVELEGLTSC